MLFNRQRAGCFLFDNFLHGLHVLFMLRVWANVKYQFKFAPPDCKRQAISSDFIIPVVVC
jgi:hypothetical protein